MEAKTVTLAGRVYENSVSVRERLGISELTLRKCIVAGKIPEPIIIARRRYFDRDEIDLWLVQPQKT